MIIWQNRATYLRCTSICRRICDDSQCMWRLEGAWWNIHQARVLALIVKLPDKMMLLTKKDLNLIGNNCLLDICVKSDLSH